MKYRARIFLGFWLLVVILCGVFLPPVMAGTVYLSGGPDLSIAISGTNEFAPGASTSVSVMVENRGLIDLKLIRPDLVSRDDLPNTAKMVKVGLGAGSAPITVKSDSQMIGDLSGGGSRSVTFNVKIAQDAPAGTYAVPLMLDYTYLYTAESEGQDNIRYYYKTEQKVLNLSLNIRPTAQLSVSRVSTDHLNVGTEGYLTLTIQNTGSENARQGVLRITRNGQSPVQPTDSSVFVESLSPGDRVTVTFKVSVATTAEGNQVYPLDLSMRYKDSEDEIVTTDPITFGVPVGGKVDFTVLSPPATIAPGQKSVIDVEYQNIGSAPVYNSQARLSAVDPFTSNDDTAFLGDLAPGESRIARFELTADGTATAKEYGLDSEIRYRDALDNSLISETMKVRIHVEQQPGLLGAVLNPITLSVLVVGCIGGVYAVMTLRKRS
jgi:hypothetical protein